MSGADSSRWGVIRNSLQPGSGAGDIESLVVAAEDPPAVPAAPSSAISASSSTMADDDRPSATGDSSGRLLRQNRRLLDELEQKRSENASLLKRLDDLVYQQNTSAKRILQQDERMRWLRNAEDRADALKERCEELQDRIASMKKLRSERDQLQAQCEALQRARDGQDTELTRLRGANAALQQRNEELGTHATQQHHLLGEANRVIEMHHRAERVFSEDAHARRERLVRRVMHRMTHRGMSLGFGTWRNMMTRHYKWHGEQHRKKAIHMQQICVDNSRECALRGLEQVTARWQGGKLSRAWKVGGPNRNTSLQPRAAQARRNRRPLFSKKRNGQAHTSAGGGATTLRSIGQSATGLCGAPLG